MSSVLKKRVQKKKTFLNPEGCRTELGAERYTADGSHCSGLG